MGALRLRRVHLGVVLALGGAVVYLTTLYPRQRLSPHPYFDAPGPWVVAHRGGAALAPENTLEAFEKALVLGVDVLEMDLRFSADGAIVVVHDATVDRTTNGRGRVADLTLAELQDLDAAFRFENRSGGFPYRGTGVTIPAFSDVLRELPEIRLNVEMKDFTPEQARTLCAVLKGHDATARVLVSAFPQGAMTAFRKACPAVATGATRREAILFYYLNRVGLGRLFRSRAIALQLPLRFRGRTVISRGLVEAARASNRPVQAWTIDDASDMRRLLDMGIQAILTDRPDRLLALLGRQPRPLVRPVRGVDTGTPRP
jgi:glycerophosphoryl diester phosphodiesterase